MQKGAQQNEKRNASFLIASCAHGRIFPGKEGRFVRQNRAAVHDQLAAESQIACFSSYKYKVVPWTYVFSVASKQRLENSLISERIIE